MDSFFRSWLFHSLFYIKCQLHLVKELRFCALCLIDRRRTRSVHRAQRITTVLGLPRRRDRPHPNSTWGTKQKVSKGSFILARRWQRRRFHVGSQRIRFRAYTDKSKVGAKVKKIKEQAKEIKKQESIPVGCVPSAFLIPGWSAQLPLDADPPLEADTPPEKSDKRFWKFYLALNFVWLW